MLEDSPTEISFINLNEDIGISSQKNKGKRVGIIEENHPHAKRYITSSEKRRIEGLKDKYNT